jgi:hypothetical protein
MAPLAASDIRLVSETRRIRLQALDNLEPKYFFLSELDLRTPCYLVLPAEIKLCSMIDHHGVLT